MKNFNNFIYELKKRQITHGNLLKYSNYEKIFFKFFSKINWKNDCENILYFLKQEFQIELNKKINGDIDSIIIKHINNFKNFNKIIIELFKNKNRFNSKIKNSILLRINEK